MNRLLALIAALVTSSLAGCTLYLEGDDDHPSECADAEPPPPPPCDAGIPPPVPIDADEQSLDAPIDAEPIDAPSWPPPPPPPTDAGPGPYSFAPSAPGARR